jgi:hypothetical protein
MGAMPEGVEIERVGPEDRESFEEVVDEAEDSEDEHEDEHEVDDDDDASVCVDPPSGAGGR